MADHEVPIKQKQNELNYIVIMGVRGEYLCYGVTKQVEIGDEVTRSCSIFRYNKG